MWKIEKRPTQQKNVPLWMTTVPGSNTKNPKSPTSNKVLVDVHKHLHCLFVRHHAISEHRGPAVEEVTELSHEICPGIVMSKCRYTM